MLERVLQRVEMKALCTMLLKRGVRLKRLLTKFRHEYSKFVLKSEFKMGEHIKSKVDSDNIYHNICMFCISAGSIKNYSARNIPVVRKDKKKHCSYMWGKY